MAVRAGNLFALDGLGTSGTGITMLFANAYGDRKKCHWHMEKQRDSSFC